MSHLPSLISDLALILVTAAIVTVIFQKLKQPLVLGYLLAGVLVGNSVSFLPNIEDPKSVQVWAEIGVIFLLFGLGLEFSYSKIAKYGKSAGLTASVEVIFMLGLGYLTGLALGWSKFDSIFLGGILSISSTSIIVRAFEEMNLKSKSFAQFVFGVLVFEDLLAILILVSFSALGASGGGPDKQLGFLSVLPMLGFFLTLTFTVGVYVLPQLLRRWKKELNDETVLIFSIGLCLLLVVLATNLGFSAALGAFLMGSILGGTVEAQRIEHLLHPIKNLFAAIFFVSVGMMIDPKFVLTSWGAILIIMLVTIVGKALSTTVGALISGQSIRDSVRSGLSLAQIGEFSFIIATLGASLGLTSPSLYPITVAVAVITTFTTPYLIRWSGPIAGWLENKMSDNFKERLLNYRQTVTTRSGRDVWGLIWEAVGFAPFINAVLVIAITLAMKNLVAPQFDDYADWRLQPYALALATLILVAPFLWGVVQSRAAHGDEARWSDFKAVFFGILIARTLFALFLAFAIFATFLPDPIASLGLIVAVFIAMYLGRRWLEPAYRRYESKFLENLHHDPTKAPNASAQATRLLTPWDAQLKKLVLSPDSDIAFQSLLDANLRDAYGVMVTMIGRGSKKILTPGRDEILLPGDTLYLIGNEEEIERVRVKIEHHEPATDIDDEKIGLSPLRLVEKSPYVGHPIRTSGLREATQGLIVGIERKGQRILNPDSNIPLEMGDLLWIVGRRDLIHDLNVAEH